MISKMGGKRAPMKTKALKVGERTDIARAARICSDLSRVKENVMGDVSDGIVSASNELPAILPFP